MAKTRAADRHGWWWALLVLAVVVEVPVALAWQIPYDPWTRTISDLGATTCTTVGYPTGAVDVCSPLHALMNGATAAGGIVLGTGALLLRRVVARGRAGVAFAVLMVVAALSWIAGAVVAVDENLTLHALLALPAFVAQNLALLCVTRAPDAPCPGWRRAAPWVGVLGLVVTVLTLPAQSWGLPLGLVERLALYPSVVWLAGIGTGLFIGRARATRR